MLGIDMHKRVRSNEERTTAVGALMRSTASRRVVAAALLICVLSASMLVSFEHGDESVVEIEIKQREHKDAAAAHVHMTQLFWPFSPSPSKKAAPAVGKASASQLSSAAKSSEHGTASNMDVKAVRQAQEVMRKLVMEDKKAARKRAEETYIKDLVAQHIKEAKLKAQAKLAAAKAAILKAKVDAAKAANLKAKVAAAKAAIPKAKSAADAQAKASSTMTTADAVVVRKTDSRLQKDIEAMARGLRRVDSEIDDATGSENDEAAAGSAGQT